MTKPTKWHVRSAKTQISLGIRPVWSESSLSAWRKLGSLATHGAHSEDSDQTGRMTLIRLGRCPGWSESSLGAHAVSLVLSRGGSFHAATHNARWPSTPQGVSLMWPPCQVVCWSSLPSCSISPPWYLQLSYQRFSSHCWPLGFLLAMILAAHLVTYNSNTERSFERVEGFNVPLRIRISTEISLIVLPAFFAVDHLVSFWPWY